MTINIYPKDGLQKKERLQPVMNIIAGSPLQKIIQKAHFLMALDDALHDILPKQFAAQCNILNVNTGAVVIGVSNASIATRLRFESADILEKIKAVKGCHHVRSVQFKVKPTARRQSSV